MKLIKNCIICNTPITCTSLKSRGLKQYCEMCRIEQRRVNRIEYGKMYNSDPFNRYMENYRSIRASPIKMIRSVMY